MIKNYQDRHACGMQHQPEFEGLSEKAKTLYSTMDGLSGMKGIVKNPREVRAKVGAGDNDVRALIRGGYLLALSEGQAMVIRCPYVRQWLEECYEQNGCQPTLEELENVFG